MATAESIKDIRDFAKFLNKEFKLSGGNTIILYDVTINESILEDKKYHYTGEQSNGENSWSIGVYFDFKNEKLKEALRHITNGQYGAKYNLYFKDFFSTFNGIIHIKVLDIKEVGISEKQALINRLDHFIESNNYVCTKRALPVLVTSVLAITSSNSKIEDDITQNIGLMKNKVTIKKCATPKEISEQINENHSKFDLIVLYRGGHDDASMDKFSSECVIEAIMNSSVPVCSALGHHRDKPYIEKIVDYVYATPSSFALEIRKHNIIKRSMIGSIHKKFENQVNIKKQQLHHDIALMNQKRQQELENAEFKKNVIIGVVVSIILLIMIF